MMKKVEKLRWKAKAARKWGQRGGRGYFCQQNNTLSDAWQADLMALRARNAERWARLERQAMANIMQGQRELGRLSA